MLHFRRHLLPAVVVLILAFASGCALRTDISAAQESYSQGHLEEALAQLKTILASEPNNTEARVAYLSLRERVINDLVTQANALNRDAGPERTQIYQRILLIDPNNSQAKGGLELVRRDQERANLLLMAQFAFDRKDYDAARVKLRSILAEDPNDPKARDLLDRLEEKANPPPADTSTSVALRKQLSIEFREATLHQVFEVLARASGVNFVLDRDVKPDQKVTLFIHDMTVGDALDVILLTNQLEQRVLERNAILIYQNTPAKQKDYQALRVRTFFLSNADAEQVAASIKTLVKTKDVVVDKTQNMIIMRDTADAIRMAERIVSLQDLPESEVMLDLEVLEVSREKLTQLGVQFPQQLSLSPLPSGTNTTVTLSDLLHVTAGTLGATIDPLKINLQGTDTDVRLLANPRIRVKNREDAKILIGDRVPNITSTSTSTGFVAENIQYLDVGLKLDVTPVISVDNEISIKIGLEVSSIANQITTPSGTLAYQIGTRTANTVLRLRDGENQVLAGLINDSDHFTRNKIPGLGDLPIIGRLFASDDSDKTKTEIVLSITPRLIRNIPRPQLKLLDFEAGTESSLHGTAGNAATNSSSPQPQSQTPAQPGIARPSLNGAPSATPGSAGTGGSAPSSAAYGGSGAPVGAPGVIAGSAVPGSLVWQGPVQAAVGSTFQEQLVLSAPQPLTGISYVLGYDPSMLSVTSVADGTLFSQSGSTDSFTQRIDAATGRIFVSDALPGASATGGAGQANSETSPSAAAPYVSGSGSLVTVSFKVIGSVGSTDLQVISISPTGLNPGANVPAPASQILNITSQ
jgi:general secretion pathway protein D